MAGNPYDAEVLVVGSGPVGASVARRLAECGRDVLLIEEGGHVSQPPGTHLRNTTKFAADPDSFLGTIIQQCELPCAGAPDSGLPGVNRTSAWGGQGIVWTNNCPRLSPHEHWPEIPGSEWETYYPLAERYLEVIPDLCPDSARQHKVRPALESYIRESGDPDRTVRTLPIAASRDGARIHYNATRDVLECIDQRAGERVRCLSSARVEQVLCDGGRVIGIRTNDNTLRAKAVVLASGALGNPSLLAKSGIAEKNLGRGVTFHPVLFAQIVLKDEFAALNTDPSPRLWIPPTPRHPWHSQILRDLNPFLEPTETVAPGRLIEFQLFCPLDIQAENRMECHADGSYSFHFEYTAADNERRARILAEANTLAERLGQFRGGCEPVWNQPGFAHLMGTHRMGRGGTTDSFGRIWETENLYLAGVGLIPNSIGINPTLTAVALGIRTADHLNRRLSATRGTGTPTEEDEHSNAG